MRIPVCVLTSVALLLLGQPSPAARAGTYEELVALFKEWRTFQTPKKVNGVPDFTPKAVAEQHRGLTALQKRVAGIDPSGWPVPQQIDYHLVRAEMNGMEFDHRVLRPWARNPCFYEVVQDSDSDVPAREGPARPLAIQLWTYRFPLTPQQVAQISADLRAIPEWLEQGKRNLVEDARDLYFLGARVKKDESGTLAALAARAAEHHPALVPHVERAKGSVDDFGGWLTQRTKTMTRRSGVGVVEHDWYMKNVHLEPYTWRDQLAIVQRELARARTHLELAANRNRDLPKLEMVATEEEYRRRYREAVREFVAFLRDRQVFTVPDYYEPALLAREGGFIPPARLRDFFTQIEYRDLRPMRGHGTHWFDLARMAREPHASSIRRVPLLYNIWDTRAEGFATGFEEIATTAGFLDAAGPRVRELVWVMLAQRGARAMGALMMHSNDWTLDQAVTYAVEHTPYGWLPRDGNTVWGEQQLYLEQPGYGTSYLIGKAHIEKLMSDRAQQLGEKFVVREFFDAFHAAGMIPVSMIRWEMTGLDDEIRELRSSSTKDEGRLRHERNSMASASHAEARPRRTRAEAGRKLK
ncbi:MAG: DUF885 family protein [Vicinamibacterales bacterium]